LGFGSPQRLIRHVEINAQPVSKVRSLDRRLISEDNQIGEYVMKVLVFVKATKDSEAGVMPTQKLLTDMGKFNEELVKAGIMLPQTA
jgi:hypothetical protein